MFYYFRYIGLNKNMVNIYFLSFYFSNVATIKLEVTYVAHFLCPLDSTALKHEGILGTEKFKSVRQGRWIPN